MKIAVEDIAIEKLKPYPNNPRVNDHAVAAVKASIKEFGFKVPIVVDKDMVIVTGHTRLKAAKQLGMTSVPCIIAEDLTDEQIKAFRVADNKTAEQAIWDFDKLTQELEALSFSFDMNSFGLDMPKDRPLVDGWDPSDDAHGDRGVEDGDDYIDSGYYGDARERTADIYNLFEVDPHRVEGPYQMPIVKATQHVPDRLIGFNYLLSSEEYDAGIHFYIDDYQFERIWNNPHKYMERLTQFDCALTPDFSLYLNMPEAMKIWNIFRSRLIGQIMQRYGIEVIQSLSWAGPESLEYCFDGLEPGGTVSVSTIGVKNDADAWALWQAGMDEAMKRLAPKNVIVYGGAAEYDFKKADVVHIKNEVTERWRENTGKGDT